MTKITFGKHKGTEVSDLPTDYLEWGSEKLDSPKWRKEFEAELKRRNDESKKRKSFIKQNVDSEEVWQMLVKEAEKELWDEEEDALENDVQYDGRVITQSEIETLAKEKLQKYQAEVELEKLDTEFMEKWGVNKSHIDKIQNIFWSDELRPSMFSSHALYEASCELVKKRDELIGKMYSL
ncbi:DUF3820 family protein [Anabaena minutissima FACHB-250]|nr:DUF3820 family protein [Anabaena minutissima FACHB-250]